MVGDILKVLLYLYLVPCLVGEGVSRILKIERTVIKDFFIGNIFIWALFQIITVPLVLERQPFSQVVFIVNVVLAGICLLTCVHEVFVCKCENLKRKHWQEKWPVIKVSDGISIAIMGVMIVGLLLAIIFLQHTDADDSRFVVNAVEILRTDRMFLTDPITGNELETWIGELVKDVTAPWAVYIAYLAKMTEISVVITAHSVMPVALILTAIAVYWLMSEEFFGKKYADRSIFVFVVLLLNIYGGYSMYTAETFFLTRIWQGKAVVASVAIPAMFLLAMWLYKNEKKLGSYILIALLNFGMCLMSSMGIIIGAILTGSIAVVYGIAKKKLWMTVAIGALCIIPVAYYVVNSSLT